MLYYRGSLPTFVNYFPSHLLSSPNTLQSVSKTQSLEFCLLFQQCPLLKPLSFSKVQILTSVLMCLQSMPLVHMGFIGTLQQYWKLSLKLQSQHIQN
jgi:hypothetical protein